MRRAAPLALVFTAAAGLATPQTPARPQAPQTTAEPIVTSLTVFAGTREGLVRSGDWGASWKAGDFKDGSSSSPTGAVECVLPIGPRVYACGSFGLFASEDFGITWTALLSDAPVLSVLPSRYPQADPTLFVGTPDGLLQSPDAGRTFKKTALTGTPVYRIEWPGPALVVATGAGLAVSDDGGSSFRVEAAGLPAGPVRALALSSFFAVDPVLFAGVSAEGVFRSGDGGKRWWPAGLAGRRVHDLVWLGPFLYAATDGGVFRSEDLGANWVPLNEGLSGPARRLLFPLAPDSGTEIFVATGRGVFRSADGGQHWQPSGLDDQDVLTLGTFAAPARTGDPRKR
jgi:hypothetical protein